MENFLLHVIVVLVLAIVIGIGLVRLVFRVSNPISAGVLTPTVPTGHTSSGSSGLGVIVVLGLLFLAYLFLSSGGFSPQDDQDSGATQRPGLRLVNQESPQNYSEAGLIPGSFYDPCAAVRDAYDNLRHQLAAEKEQAARDYNELLERNRELTHTIATGQRALADSTAALNNQRQIIRQQDVELQQAAADLAQEYEQRLLAETARDRNAREKAAAEQQATAEQNLRLRYHVLFLGLLGLNVLGLVLYLLRRRGWLTKLA
jgi:hypothetical protein